MSDNKGAPSTLDCLVDESRDYLAREIGEMDPDNPARPERLKELHALTELSRSLKSEQNKTIYKRMDELAREGATLKPTDPRRANIVSDIIRLSRLISK